MRFIILLLVGFAVRAEIFIGPTSETNRLQIGTNETLVVSAWIGTGGGPLLPIVLNSVTNNFYVADTDGDDISYGIPLYFPGPGGNHFYEPSRIFVPAIA